MTAQPTRDVISGALPLQSRKAEIPMASVDAEAREFDVVISTGAKVRRYRYEGWDTRIAFDEELVISDKACTTERVAAGAVMLLDSHSTWGGVTKTFGKVIRAWVEDGKLMGRVKLHDAGVSEETDKLVGMIRGGTAPSVSARYTIDEAEVTQPEKRGDVEQMRVTRWSLYEVSFVAVPADAGAGLRAAEMIFPVTINRAAMPTIEEKTMANDTIETASPGVESGEQRGAPGEKSWTAREIKAIQTRCGLFGLDLKLATEAMEATRDLETATDWLQQKAVDAQPRRTVPKIEILRDEGDTRRRAVGDAILHHANKKAVKLDDASRQWAGMSLLATGQRYLEEEHGVNLRGLGPTEVASVVMGMTRASGMQSTSDFPLILANIANKRLQAAYVAKQSDWKKFCRQHNVRDFKTRYVNRLSEAPSLEKVNEDGEFKYGKVTEQGESYALATYGKVVAFTRQSLINDELDAFDRIPSMFGEAAARMEADIVWAIFTANAAMGDGVALFHATHTNLATGGGSALSITSLGTARTALRKQKNQQSKQFINVEAKYLIIPAALETTADQIIAQNLVPALTSSVVPEWYRSLTPIVEPRLDDASATAWYLAASPDQIDTIEYAYLEGQEGVYSETRMGFEVDGMEFKFREDFAAKAIDWRGLYKSAGA